MVTVSIQNSMEKITFLNIFKKKTKIKLPYDPEIPLLGIHPEKTISEKRHTYAKDHSSIVYNVQGVEAI